MRKGHMRKVAQFLRGNATLLVFLALVVGALWALISIPPQEVGWIKKVDDVKREELENEARKTIIQVVGGAFAIFAIFLTLKRVVVAEQGHITDRYTKAIAQLGKLDGDKRNIEVRLGGIYALERIALDSPRDHWTIMEVLTAYVRRNAPAPDDSADETITDVRADIQAILTVLGRRRWRRETDDQHLDLGATDLRKANLIRAHLKRAYLDRAHLEEAILAEACLEGSDLRGAHLEGAFLQKAQSEGATLTEARLEGAELTEAHLERSVLLGAHLERARLFEAHLTGANLRGAHLEGALFLTPEQIRSAQNWEHAHYSAEFRRELGLPDARDDADGARGTGA
jgi:hypothetical protein